MRLGLATFAVCFGALIGSAIAEDGSGVGSKSPVDLTKPELPAQTPAPTQLPAPAKKPLPPGSARVTTPAPEQGKWDVVVGPNPAVRTFTCKPLACADTERVTIVTSRSPTLNPDPQALEKYATVDFPNSLKASSAAQEILSGTPNQTQTLLGKTSRLKGYPSVLNETKFTINKKPIFLDTAVIFAGPVLLKITSISPNRELAQKSLNEFVNAADIELGPPPAAQPAQGAAAPLTNTTRKPPGESL